MFQHGSEGNATGACRKPCSFVERRKLGKVEWQLTTPLWTSAKSLIACGEKLLGAASMRISILCTLALLAGCSADVDNRSDVPVNERKLVDASKRPSVAGELEPIGMEIIALNNLSDAGCAISADDSAGILFMARMEDPHFLLNGELVALMPSPGDQALPYGVSTHYEGPGYSAKLSIDMGSQRVVGPETSDYTGSLDIRDTSDRIAFTHSGTIQCGA